MAINLRTWYYKIDPELRLIHANVQCRAYKFARKYNYGYELTLRDEIDALRLDRMLTEEGFKICHTCWSWEQGLAKKDGRKPRPGFLKEPPK